MFSTDSHQPPALFGKTDVLLIPINVSSFKLIILYYNLFILARARQILAFLYKLFLFAILILTIKITQKLLLIKMSDWRDIYGYAYVPIGQK